MEVASLVCQVLLVVGVAGVFWEGWETRKARKHLEAEGSNHEPND